MKKIQKSKESKLKWKMKDEKNQNQIEKSKISFEKERKKFKNKKKKNKEKIFINTNLDGKMSGFYVVDWAWEVWTVPRIEMRHKRPISDCFPY